MEQWTIMQESLSFRWEILHNKFLMYQNTKTIHQVENMRNNKLKTVREKWSHSKFFIGKNRVLSKALGGTQEEEYAEGLSMVARYC